MLKAGYHKTIFVNKLQYWEKWIGAEAVMQKIKFLLVKHFTSESKFQFASLSAWKKQGQREDRRNRNREICWFISQIVIAARAESGWARQNQEPSVSSRSPTWVQGPENFSHHTLVFSGCWQGDGQKWSCWAQISAHTECQHHRPWIYPISNNASPK